MARRVVYADEAGNFDFSNGVGASEFFILTTVTFFADRQACRDLDALRYELAWSEADFSGAFRATEELQAIRDRIFGALAPHDFRVDATVLQKRKAAPHLRVTHERFYKIAWFYHMKRVAPRICGGNDELLVIASSIGTVKKQDAFHAGVVDVMNRVLFGVPVKTAHWPAAADSGLQIADYCSWAIQRKWESGDSRSYALIKPKIRSEIDLFRGGAITYY